MTSRNPQRLRRSQLTSAILATFLISGMAFAQDTGNNDDDQDDEQQSSQQQSLDKIEVVGSRIKRAEVEGPSPVTIITAEQIEREGFNTVYDALETISQNTGFAQNDFNAAGGFTPNASVINLRGLGPGRTLLLINGRRANDYPFPYNGRSNFQNFNSIPAAAVQRIEILAGGASAIYGSDAVAGVINVVLKTNFEGNEIRLKGQTSTQGGRDIGDLQWVGGKTGDNWSVTYAFESYNAEPLFGWQRDFMDSAEDNPAPPGVNGTPGINGYQPPIGIQLRRLNANGTTNSYIQPAGRDCSGSSFYRPHTYVGSTSTTLFPNGQPLGPGCGYDRFPAEQTVLNGNNDLSGYVYGTYNFNDNLEGWASVMAFHSRSRLGGGVEQWFGGPQPNATFYSPNVGFRVLPIRALTPESYGGSEGTFQKFEENSYDLAFGLRGTIADRFDWDWSIGGAKYQALRERPRLTVSGTTNYFLGPRLGTTGVGPYTGLVGVPNGLPVYNLNLDRFYGPITQADYASMSTLVKYNGKSENASTTFVLSGDLFEMPAGPVGFAAMAEASRQSYDLESDRRILPDIREIYNLTGTGGGGKRNRYALGAELRIPVFSMLDLSLAGRFDKYDDITQVDDAKTWGAGLEFRPFENLLIRGNYATSFKAPDMHYVFAERGGSFGAITDFYRCFLAGIAPSACGASGGTYNYSAFTISQGDPDLIEETGKSWTAGIVWDITDTLSITADYYEIDLENVVTVQSGTAILNAEYGCLSGTGRYPNGSVFPFAPDSAFCIETLSRIDRDPNTNALTEIRSGPINLAFQGVKGIDATVSYALDTDRFGSFNTTLAWSHVLEQTQRASVGDPVLSYRDFNSNADYRSRVRWSTSWRKGDWDATVLMNRIGSFPIWNPNNLNFVNGRLDSRVGPHFIWNMTVGKKITDNLYIRANVNNVFDRIGPRDNTFNSYPYFWSGFSPVGREIGLEMRYKFN